MEFKAAMEAIAESLDHILNGKKRGDKRSTGFVLLVFPFGDKSGLCNYISNGADRGDIVNLMREQIKRFENDGSTVAANPEESKH